MKITKDEFNSNQSTWYRAGYAARLNYLDGEVPLCWDLEAKAEWRRGYNDCERDHFSGGEGS